MYIKVTFTNGVGNNLFQYFFGYLVARRHGGTLLNPPLAPIGVGGKFDWRAYLERFDHVVGDDETNFVRYFEAPFWHNLRLDKCYPMDYRVFLPYIGHLKERFPPPTEINEHDLVFHLRLGDRLLRRSDYAPGMKLDLDELSAAIRRFDFKRLHIVTDMP